MFSGKAGKNYTIKLYPVLPKGVFKPQRFSPDMNNIRPHWFKGQESTEEEGGIYTFLVRLSKCYVNVLKV